MIRPELIPAAVFASTLALLIAVIYVLGAITGGSLLAVLRKSLEGSKRQTA